MALPPSFARDGFKVSPKTRLRRILIGTEGGANTGKTEFAWSAPGPGIHLAIDRGHSAVLESTNPPDTRSLIEGDNLIIVPIKCPLNTSCTKAEALTAWQTEFWPSYTKALGNVDARTVIVDGDSDGFEWQMLCEFGRTTQIPQIQRTSLNAARRAMIAKAWDSGKIVITTNKLKKKYEDKLDPSTGAPLPDPQQPGKTLREWDGVSYERQGFNDHEYLYELQLRHLYRRGDAETANAWGVQILLCKANRNLEGLELWDGDCNLRTVLELAYPHIPADEWGY